MKITVSINWYGKYQFFENTAQQLSYYGWAASSIFKGDYANIYNRLKKKELAIRTGKVPMVFWKINQTSYIIEFVQSNRRIELKCESYKNGHWSFEFSGSKYNVYFHGRRKKSLYKDELQVAKFVYVEQLYYIISNSDEDVLMLIGLFTTFNMGDVDIDMVLDIYDDAKQEDNTWQPSR